MLGRLQRGTKPKEKYCVGVWVWVCGCGLVVRVGGWGGECEWVGVWGCGGGVGVYGCVWGCVWVCVCVWGGGGGVTTNHFFKTNLYKHLITEKNHNTALRTHVRQFWGIVDWNKVLKRKSRLISWPSNRRQVVPPRMPLHHRGNLLRSSWYTLYNNDALSSRILFFVSKWSTLPISSTDTTPTIWMKKSH